MSIFNFHKEKTLEDKVIDSLKVNRSGYAVGDTKVLYSDPKVRGILNGLKGLLDD